MLVRTVNIHLVTTDGAPSPVQLDLYQRLWDLLLEPDDETDNAEDQDGGN